MQQVRRPRAWFGLRSGRRPPRNHPIVRRFFADRSPHLAAMVAYYALLSLVPFLFLMLSLIGVLERQNEQSFLVEELEQVLPGQSVGGLIALVENIRLNARSYGLIGFVGLLWSSLGFLSAIESALNIVYDVPNRPFVRQKLLTVALVVLGLCALFASLVVTTWVQRHSPDLGTALNGTVLLSVAFSAGVSFVFLLVIYRLLPNTPVSVREAVPGALVGTMAFQLSFQALPLYLGFSESQPALKAFNGLVVLLVWLFLMSNVLLLGAQVNHWYGRARPALRAAEARG
jgi:membrane protein